jgi:hypothetical protein
MLLTAPSVWRSSSFPTVHSRGKVYVCHATPIKETEWYELCPKVAQHTLTVTHHEAGVIDCLPIIKSLDNCPFCLTLGIMVVLDEVPDDKLVLALCLQNKPQHEAMEYGPAQRMEKMEIQCLMKG